MVVVREKDTDCCFIYLRMFWLSSPALVYCEHVCTFAQLCPTVCDPVDYSPPGSSVSGIFQARILERVIISFSWEGRPSLIAQLVKNPLAMWDTWVRSLGWGDPLEKGMATTPVFLPGEFHGLRSLVGYSPWGHKELDTTE